MRKRELLSYTPAVLILLAFIVIGVSAWTGSTGNWTPGYYEESRINASVGVYSADYYRGGSNYTAWIETLVAGSAVNYTYPEYDYYIRNDAGTYRAYASNGSLEFSNADFASVFNDAATDLGWVGTIAIEGGATYTATTQAWINGTGSPLEKNFEVVGVGGGVWPTIAPSADNIDGFRLSGGPNIYLHNFHFDMKTTGTSGCAISGINKGGNAYTENAAWLGRFEDLKMEGGTSGQWLWHMQDMEWIVFGGNFYLDGASGVNGAFFETTSASQYNYGECLNTGSWYISTNGANTVGMYLKGTSGHEFNLFHSYGKIWIRNDAGSANTTGFWGERMVSCDISGLHLENLEYHFRLNDSDYNHFDWGFQTTTIQSDSLVVDLDSGCQANTISTVHILAGTANVTAFRDANTDTNSPNTYDDIFLRSLAGGEIQVDMAAGVYYDDDYGAGRWYKKLGGGVYP